MVLSPQAQSYPGRNLIPSQDFPQAINSVEELDEVILTRLRQLGQSSERDSAAIAFAMIHHARLTPAVFKELRSKYFLLITSKLLMLCKRNTSLHSQRSSGRISLRTLYGLLT